MDAVLFDLYDTLLWTEWPLLRDRLARAIGIGPRELMQGFERTREARGIGAFGSPEGDLRAVLVDAGASLGDEDVRRVTEAEMAALAERGVHLYDDALPVLRELRRQGIRTGIVSNCDHWTRPVVNALGLEDEVDAVVLSFEVGVMKPDPRIFRISLERMWAQAEETTFVDDQVEYLDRGVRVGMRTLQIIRPADAGTPDPGPHPVIENLWAVLPPT